MQSCAYQGGVGSQRPVKSQICQEVLTTWKPRSQTCKDYNVTGSFGSRWFRKINIISELECKCRQFALDFLGLTQNMFWQLTPPGSLSAPAVPVKALTLQGTRPISLDAAETLPWWAGSTQHLESTVSNNTSDVILIVLWLFYIVMEIRATDGCRIFFSWTLPSPDLVQCSCYTPLGKAGKAVPKLSVGIAHRGFGISIGLSINDIISDYFW